MKTKEEIFDEQYHIWSGSDNSIKLHMLEAMKIFADQEKQALKVEILKRISEVESSPDNKKYEGAFVWMKDLLEMI